MSILSKRSSFLGAIFFITAMLFSSTSFAQIGTLRIWTYEDTTATYAQFPPWCDPGTNPATCIPRDGLTVCIAGPTCVTTDADGQAIFPDLTQGTIRVCLETPSYPAVVAVAGSAGAALVGDQCIDADLNGPDIGKAMYVEDAAADLSITKVSNPVSVTVVAGTNLMYTITVTNLGPNEATGVEVGDSLPLGLFGPCSWTAGETGGATGFSASGNQSIADSSITMPNASIITYDLTCLIPSDTDNGLNLFNKVGVAFVDDPDLSNNNSQVSNLVVRESAISITKTADPSPLVAQGGTQTYTIEVSNGGPSDASNLFVTETLPAGLTVTAMNPPAICNGTSGTVTCALPGPVAAGDSYSFTLEMDIPDDFPLGTITNTARVECTDPACSTNTTPEESAVQAEAQTRVVVAVPADGTALIAVQKFFTDGNDETPVTLTLECTTGSYAPATVVVNPDEFAPGSAFEHIFVVTDIPSGAANACTVVEEPVAGYDATYICGQNGSTSTVDDTLCNGFADFTPGTTACGWLDVAAGDSNLCGIFNDPAPVELAVSKVWAVSDAGGGDAVNLATEIVIYCDSEIVGGYPDDGDWYYQQYIVGDATVTVNVYPVFDGSTCWVEEPNVESSVEVDNGCESVDIELGQDAACMITNTVFFEGIPTLNQYGLAIMALLMLGIGMVGFRRFV